LSSPNPEAKKKRGRGPDLRPRKCASRKRRLPTIIAGYSCVKPIVTQYSGKGRPRKTDQALVLRKENELPGNDFFINFLLRRDRILSGCPAYSREDRARAALAVAGLLGLYDAKKAGLINGWLLVWGKNRKYPAQPKGLRLYLPGGERELVRRLGNPLLKELRQISKTDLGDGFSQIASV
jgi:hypothetical protein